MRNISVQILIALCFSIVVGCAPVEVHHSDLNVKHTFDLSGIEVYFRGMCESEIPVETEDREVLVDQCAKTKTAEFVEALTKLTEGQ